jgi:hypothetical protein
MFFWSIIGLFSVLLVTVRFVKQLGQSLPILEFMLLIAGLQWIIGPLIEYNFPSFHHKYYMYVTESVYMSYVVPAYLMFSGVVLFKLIPFYKIKLPIENFVYYDRLGLIIFSIGVIFDIFGGLLPNALNFFSFILSNFKFVGAIILYFSVNKKLKKLFYISIAYLFFIALSKAMFHDFLLWSVFFFMFWAFKHKPSLKVIFLTFVLGGILIVSLQTIKSAYRSEVWNGFSGNKAMLFVNLFSQSFLSEGSLFGEGEIDTQNNVRLNQGWIISAIIDHVPNNQDFVNGETVLDAVAASLLPRFLNPNKTMAGGRDNFKRFTGLEISDGTSMGISIIGEAYGNFNVFGGIIFMGIWGWFLVKVWISLIKYGFNNVLFLAFLPLIFLQVIKAETELVVVLNHLIKSLLVVFAYFYFSKKKLVFKSSYV